MIFLTFRVVGGAGSLKSDRLADDGSVGMCLEFGPRGRSGLACAGGRDGTAFSFCDISGFGVAGDDFAGPLKAKLNFDEFC
jgi:hypothetical protein